MCIVSDGSLWTTEIQGRLYRNDFLMATPGGSTSGICGDSKGNIYYSDAVSNKIYRLDKDSKISVFAGSGNPAYGDGYWIFSGFNHPQALACDPSDNIYVWDAGNYLIRKIDPSSNVTTFSGTYQKSTPSDGTSDVGIQSVSQMTLNDNGDLLLVCGNCVRRISGATKAVTTIAGSFSQNGYTNGSGELTRFNGASGLCVNSNVIFVADTQNQRIRKITFDSTSQILPQSNLSISNYIGVTITGTVGKTYQIQSSSDMTSWRTETNFVLSSSPYLWVDQSGARKKFYRGVILP